MIYDSFENVEVYCEEDDSISVALDFASNFDLSQPDGKYEIDGDDMFAIVMSGVVGAAEEKHFEAHEKYLDVQIVFEGVERHDVVLLDNIEIDVVEEYDDERDVMVFETDDYFSTIILRHGEFVVYGPEDGHRSFCSVDESEFVRKVCVKIRMEQ